MNDRPCGTQPALLALYAGTMGLGAFLLFWVQPMFAKMVLPLLGGDKAGHDWANMLGMLGLLDYDQIVGGFFYVLALLTFVALLALPRYMLKITSRN